MGAVAGELSSRLAHPAWPTGGAAVLALIAGGPGFGARPRSGCAVSLYAVGNLPARTRRMCEAMTDTSGQPAMPSKVGVRKRGRTPPSLQEPAGPKVVVRERGRRQHSVEKPKRPKVALRERVKEADPRRRWSVVRDPSEPTSTIPLPEPKSPRLPQPTPGLEAELVSAVSRGASR